MISSAAVSVPQVERFRTIAARKLGLRFDDGKLGFLAEILRKRIDASGRLPDVYLGEIEAREPRRDELRILVQELTVTETYFFRNADQLRAFGEIVPADPVFCAQSGWRRLRILSAGCASGEEAYSLAILVRDLPALAHCEVTIRAIDANVAMLEKAALARYSAWSLRETPADVQARCFQASGREFVLDPSFRSAVTFEERNLIEDDPSFWQPNAFDVVFCRNVVMYFSPETAAAVIARICRSLVPGGFLFLGYAETLRGLSQDFHLRHTHNTFYYQRLDDAERSRHPPAPPGLDHASLLPVGPALTNIDPDQSWVETIRRASERIHSLTTKPAPGADVLAPVPSPLAGAPKVAWDLGCAIELMRQEKFSDARAILTTLPPESARDPDVLLLRAVLLTHGGDLVAAEKLCTEVLQLDEMSAGAHYLTALCREDAGDRRGASDHDQVATYLDPAFAMPRLHLGLLARRAGDHGTARRELAEALVLLQREEASRLLLFAGGFGREALLTLCRAELSSCGDLS